MKAPFIVTIRAEIAKTRAETQRLQFVAQRRFGEYMVYKIKPVNSGFSYNNVRLNDLMMIADTVYNTSKGTFEKNRYGFSNMPKDLDRLYKPIMDIIEFKPPFEELDSKYSKINLAQAIYLTNTYGEYAKDIDQIDYQLIRYRFGKEVPKGFLPELVERYPEKLI